MSTLSQVLNLTADVSFELDGYKGKYIASCGYICFGGMQFQTSAASERMLQKILKCA